MTTLQEEIAARVFALEYKLTADPKGFAMLDGIARQVAQERGLPEPKCFRWDCGRAFHYGDMTAGAFEQATGRPPENDDLERVNCGESGFGHLLCGWDNKRGLPRFLSL